MSARFLPLLFLLAVLPAPAQDRKKPPSSKNVTQTKDDVSIEYDRFTDVTTIAAPLRKIEPNVYLNFAVIYSKETLSNPLRSYEIIVTQPPRGTRFSHKEFGTVHFILDGEKRLHVELAEYLPESFPELISETARMHLTEAEFNQLTAAKKIEVQWGNTEFEFDKKSLADLSKVKQLYDGRGSASPKP